MQAFLSPTVMLGGIGILLFLGGAWLARGIVSATYGSVRDPVGLGRVLGTIGLVLMILAIAVRPENPRTAAVERRPTDTR